MVFFHAVLQIIGWGHDRQIGGRPIQHSRQWPRLSRYNRTVQATMTVAPTVIGTGRNRDSQAAPTVRQSVKMAIVLLPVQKRGSNLKRMARGAWIGPRRSAWWTCQLKMTAKTISYARRSPVAMRWVSGLFANGGMLST